MSDIPFTKDNLDGYLKELSKEFRKMNGSKIPAEIILIGGASVLINYGFREMTYDMDAIIQALSSMKDAINHVGSDGASKRMAEYRLYENDILHPKTDSVFQVL